MNKLHLALIIFFLLTFNFSCTQAQQSKSSPQKVSKGEYPVQKSEEEWKKLLSPEAYEVLRKQGTERAFTGKYWDNKKSGLYVCAACEKELFESDTKFKSGTGWPSFWKPSDKDAVKEIKDKSYGMVRTEVVCSDCGGHLGHVFNDGPEPTGLRYCLNSVSLKFIPVKKDN